MIDVEMKTQDIGIIIWRHALQILFFGIWRALSQKIIIMMSLQSDDEECICDVVVLEKPRCPLVCSKGLDSIDTLGKASSFADNESMTRKPRSRLRWMPAANVASLPRIEGQLRWHHFQSP